MGKRKKGNGNKDEHNSSSTNIRIYDRIGA